MRGIAAEGGRGRRLRRIAAAAVAMLAIGAVAAWQWAPDRVSRTAEHADASDDDDAKAGAAASGDARDALPARTVRLGEAARGKGDIATIVPERIAHQGEIRAYGTVLDLDALVLLHASYINATTQRDSAKARADASKATFERYRTLYAGRTSSLAQLETADANFRADQAAVVAAESQVRTLAATAKEEWGPVLGGALVDNTDLINELIDREDLLVQITRRGGEAGELSDQPPSPIAEIQSGAMRAEARFLSLATQSDPKIQGQSYLYVAPASSGLLPGMSVIASLPTGRTVDAYRVPGTSGLWWDGRLWAYVESGPDLFTREPLADVETAEDGSLIVPATAFGTERPTVVVKGAQALLSEEFRARIQLEDDD